MAATSGWSPSHPPTSSTHISPTSSTLSQMSLKAAFTSLLPGGPGSWDSGPATTGFPGQPPCAAVGEPVGGPPSGIPSWVGACP
eukprot:13349463-Heterocapsa_arctica.AAC.1